MRTLQSRQNRTANRIWALSVIVGIVVLGLVTMLAFRGSFQPRTTVRVEADRTGLALLPGALVKRNGVKVGTVTSIEPTTTGATITLAVDPAAATRAPRNSTVQIKSTNVFGAKNVFLVDPPHPLSGGLPDGTIIAASSVSVELNTVFSNLVHLLDAVEPHKLNAITNTVATALRGNGTNLGKSIDDLNDVLQQVNPRIGTITTVLQRTGKVADTYASASADLLAALRNIHPTARTITDKQTSIDSLLMSTIAMSEGGTAVLAPNSGNLVSAIQLLTPTATLLQRYSPEFTCVIKGMDVARAQAEKVTGGNGYAMLLNSTVVYGVDPYRYPNDLPKVAAKGGPWCGPLPQVQLGDLPTPYVVADTGTNPFAHSTGSPRVVPETLLEFLLGGGAVGMTPATTSQIAQAPR